MYASRNIWALSDLCRPSRELQTAGFLSLRLTRSSTLIYFSPLTIVVISPGITPACKCFPCTGVTFGKVPTTGLRFLPTPNMTTVQENRMAFDQIVLKKIISWEFSNTQPWRSITQILQMLDLPARTSLYDFFQPVCRGKLLLQTVLLSCHGSLLVCPTSLLSVQKHVYVWRFVKSDAESQTD